MCLDELGKMLGKGTFGKVIECKDLKRLVDKENDALFVDKELLTVQFEHS